MNPKITVLTPTARRGGVDIWKESLQSQTFTDFEALLIDELWDSRAPEVGEAFKDDMRFFHLVPPEKLPGTYWNLSASLNWGLRLARGELIVFVQDYIALLPEGLARFWELYQEVGPALITGVGHQYLDQSFNEKVFTDPRIQGRGVVVANPLEWESNWACAAKVICEKIGGFDPEFDFGRGYDNVNFAERAQLAGYLIWLDEQNQSFGISHEHLFNEFEMKAKAPSNEALWRRKHGELYA